MNYSVTLDEVASTINPSDEGNMTFGEAIQHVLDYCVEAGYDLQEAVFEAILNDGEDAFLENGSSLRLA